MSGGMKGKWRDDKDLARAMLTDRQSRRRWLARFLMLALAVLALGLWVIDGWLAASTWRFMLWWAGCGLIAFWVMLFALYDVLMVLREERQRHHADSCDE